MNPSVSIIIPNWNGADLLKAYLPSIQKAQANYPGDSELIVVDDASTDYSVAMLETLFPRVRLVRHEKNEGFGKACGSGAKAAIHPYIILLNSDIAVESDFIQPLLRPFENPEVFTVSPLILNKDGSPVNVTINTPYLRRGKIRYKPARLEHLQIETAPLPYPWHTLFPLGGAFAADKKRFLALGGFDPLFEPFYYEDTDLGFRAWRRGWTCVVSPESRVTHFHNGTIARSFKYSRIKMITKRNRLLFLWKNLTTPALFRQHIFFHLLRLLYAPFKLNGLILAATLLAIPKYPEARKQRGKEKEAEVRTEKEIFAEISRANKTNYEAVESAGSFK